MKKLLVATSMAFALAVSTNAFAAVISATDILTNSIAGATVTSSGPLGVKATAGVDGFAGVGVIGGTSGNEIDVNQFITISFAEPTKVDSIVVGLLFPKGQYDDEANEIAKFTFGTGKKDYTTLTAMGATTAKYSVPGVTVNNLSPALDGSVISYTYVPKYNKHGQPVGYDKVPVYEDLGYAAWEILNPFGDELVDFVTFTAVNVSGRGVDSNSDYTIVGLETKDQPVPEPASLALVGLGVLGVFARRKK